MKTIECPSCGNGDIAQISYATFRCNHCGVMFTEEEENSAEAPAAGSAGYQNFPRVPDVPNKALGFLAVMDFPVGFVLHGFMRDEKPRSARVYLKCAIWGIILPIITIVAYYATFFLIYGIALGSALIDL